MKPGDLVCWKFRWEMNLDIEYGFLLESHTPKTYDPFPWWSVLFPSQGIVHCRESDLIVVEPQTAYRMESTRQTVQTHM